MLKVRIIPVLTFNGLSLVKTKTFSQPRIVGNPIQSARVYNSRNVDELIFVDINATYQKRKINTNLVKRVIDECFMPVTIGGGINTFDDINDLLRIGADKVVIKTKAIKDLEFIKSAVKYFGSQCISIAVDAYKENDQYFINNIFNFKLPLNEFISDMVECRVGEFVVNSVDNDGMMNGYDKELFNSINKLSSIPTIALGGAGTPKHFEDLYNSGFNGAMGAASIFHFTQFTPLEVKRHLWENKVPIRL